MLLKYFYDKALAHASYMVGCQRTGEAVVIDPGRNITPYLQMAETEGMKIVAVAETHIHADFVSGCREMHARIGAKMYLSDEGTADWKYQYATAGNAQLVKDGDSFKIGNIKFDVLHTPGHTPEHICFVLTDEGGGANRPMGIFTGDFVFVGSIGRPDLLENAAGIVGSAEIGARQLFHSIKKFRDLPDYLQVWPAHGAGSACGKGLGAVPSSTVGYEKLFNPALQYHDEQKFVDYILSEQPEAPFYFAVMKRVNKVGPTIISEIKTPALINQLNADDGIGTDRLDYITKHNLVIDTRPSVDYASGHKPGTINIPTSYLVQWAGFLVDYNQPIYLLSDSRSIHDQLISLRSIGIDNVAGYLDAQSVCKSGWCTESYPQASVGELRPLIESQQVHLIDVRAETEFSAGRIAEAEHWFLGKLMRTVNSLPKDKPIVAQCLSGGRSAIAASILQRAGYQVTNLKGGYRAWLNAGYPVCHDTSSCHV